MVWRLTRKSILKWKEESRDGGEKREEVGMNCVNETQIIADNGWLCV
jgi:hypothetical protein